MCTLFLKNPISPIDKLDKMSYNNGVMKKIIHNVYIAKPDAYFHHASTIISESEHYSYGPEVHKMCEILWLLSGHVQYNINGNVYNVQPGDCILLNANEIHSVHLISSEPYERFVLQFSPDLLPSSSNLDIVLAPFSSAQSYHRILPAQLIKDSKIPCLFRTLNRKCLKQDESTILDVVSHIFLILKELNYLTFQFAKSVTLAPVTQSTSEAILKNCITYINENITQNLQISDIANHCHICVSHLHHLFKKEMHTSLHSYIINQKMQLAAIMLRKGISPQETADSLGYSYYSTFSRNFISFFNCLPNQYLHQTARST